MDDVARWLASPVSRRRALKLGGGVFAGMAIAPLRPRAAFAPPGYFTCAPATNSCREWICETGRTCCPRPHDPNIQTVCPSGDCCDPCNPASSQCGSDGYCHPGAVAAADSCCPGGVVCGNDCCRKGQQCLSPPAVANGPLCYACPDSITNLAQCPNRVQSGNPSQNGCGPEGTTPAITNFLNRFGEANFKPACNAHDTCYGDCRRSQESCDAEFRDRLKSICIATYPDNFDERGQCIGRSKDYYLAVRTRGRDAYEKAQRENCQCCPDSPLDKSELPSAPPSPQPTAPGTLVPQGNRVKVPVTCSGSTACEGTLGLSAIAGSGGRTASSSTTVAAVRRRRMIPLGTATFSIPAGQTAHIKVPLSREGRRLLRERKRLTVLVTAQAQLANGKRVDTGLDSFVLRTGGHSRR